MRKQVTAIAILLAGTFTLSACKGGDKVTPPPAPAAMTQPADQSQGGGDKVVAPPAPDQAQGGGDKVTPPPAAG
ncbi:MAG: hypothetical protein WCE48_05665, partial [Steroidobacteraceae bacterium]